VSVRWLSASWQFLVNTRHGLSTRFPFWWLDERYDLLGSSHSRMQSAASNDQDLQYLVQWWGVESSGRTCPRVWPEQALLHRLVSHGVSSHLSCAFNSHHWPCVLVFSHHQSHPLITHVNKETRRNGLEFPFVMELESKKNGPIRNGDRRRAHTRRHTDNKTAPVSSPRDPAEAAAVH
jgi:hypothetical protein